MKVSKKDKRKFHLNWFLFLPILLISGIGIVSLLSTTIQSDGSFGELGIVNRQIIFLCAGLIIYFLLSLVDISFFKHWQLIIPIYVGTILLLVWVLLFGPVINNVRRWLIIGGIQIQPSEIAKVTVIFTTAWIFSFKERYNEWILFFLSLLLVIPLVVLIYLEPAGSMSLLTLGIWFLVAFTGLSNQLRNTVSLIVITLLSSTFLLISISGNWIFLLLVLLALVISIFSYYYRNSWRIVIAGSVLVGIFLGSLSLLIYQGVLKDYQKDRIVAFINPSENSEDIGFNVNQARIAIGSGRIWGKGFGNGTQSKRDFLPEHQTDFIFASFAEEFGLVGALILLSLYSIVVFKGLMVAVDNSDNLFVSMIVIGIMMKIVLEIFINIGTNTGIIPATGIPLPLVSAGGTITLMTLFSLGVIQSIMNRQSKVRNDVRIIDNW
jgi:rod shape determining protein RodA